MDHGYSNQLDTALRHNVLQSWDDVVLLAMCLAVAVIVGLCLYLLFKWAAEGTPFEARPRRSRTEEEKEADRRRREKLRFWPWRR